MKIKTRLQLSIILSLILTATIGIFVLVALRQMSADIEEARTATEIVKGMAELKIVTHEYLLRPTDRSLMQWKSTYDYLIKRLMKKANEFESPAEKIALGKILKNITRFKAAFSNLTTGFEKEQGLGRQESAIPPDLRDRLIGELLVKSQATVSPVFQFQQVIQTELVRKQQRTSLLIVIFIVILAVFVTAISLWINRSIARPIAELEKDIRIVGSGNLDHKVGTTAKDEIGQLSRSFDMMTGDLKETTTSIVELNREIDERKRAEEALRESEEKHRSMMESMHDLVYICSPDYHVEYMNPAMVKRTGRDAIGELCYKVINELDEECPWCVQDKVQQGENRLTEIDSPRDNRTYNVSHFPVHNADGSISKLSIYRDVTEIRKMEAQFQQATKMEAIATLAGGVAHEFNNALSSITGYTGLLEMDYPQDEKITEYTGAMKQSAHRMARLTDQLLAYARGGKYDPEIQSLNSSVKDTLALLQHTLDPAVRVETDLPLDVKDMEADSTQMQMVISAIMANSNEAMEGPGRIRISTRNMDLDQELIKDYPGLKPGPYVCLSIEDDGKGMDEETRRRIFDPFFTTHFMGRGLGMAAVYGIIRNHDGAITVDSELGKGTKVCIYLPAISAESREQGAKAVKQPEVELAMGEGTILVIEDEEDVMMLIRKVLDRLGYRVLQAETGKKAIRLAETFDGQIDLAILDIKLPDMTGDKVYPLIMEARPDLKVVVCSGYTIDGPPQDILDAGAEGFIQKPFSISTFAEKLKEVLGD